MENNNLKNNIENTFQYSPSGVHAVFFGPKTKNGQTYENQKCIVFMVEQKKPISQLSENEILPKTIDYEGVMYQTDVIQSKKFSLQQCYPLTDERIVLLQSRVRPLSGGVEISPLSHWSVINNQYSYGVGTMGFIAKDNEDGTLVGVTNNHVIINDAFVNSDKALNDKPYSIVDTYRFSGRNFTNRVLQFGSSDGTVNFTTDKIGIPKRYVPISTTGSNTTDVALFTIDDPTQITNCQFDILNSCNLDFCTTQELDDIPFNNYPVYSVGRTTGPKGTLCPLEFFGSYLSFDINYSTANDMFVGKIITMSNCILFRFQDQSNLPSFSGDSGSALIVDINGTLKIAGLLFAGDTSYDESGNPISTFGAGCRIDEIASQINISAWKGETITNNLGTTPKKLEIVRPLSDTRTTIVSGGKTFYLAGTQFTNKDISNI
jgi:hypothetical protein